MEVTAGAQLSVFSILCILIGLDLWISQKRWKQFGVKIELNPLVRYLAQQSTKMGLAGLLLVNLILLWLAVHSQTFLLLLTGAKFSLAMLQLRSLIQNK